MSQVFVYSVDMATDSSVCLPLALSVANSRVLALRARIFLRSLSSFSLVMTTYKGMYETERARIQLLTGSSLFSTSTMKKKRFP